MRDWEAICVPNRQTISADQGNKGLWNKMGRCDKADSPIIWRMSSGVIVRKKIYWNN